MNKKYTLLLFLFIILLTAPYFVSKSLVSVSYHYSGFLVNPIDGNSYLAKMQQGQAGEWLFKLPYTSNPGEGVFLFTYYLFLGHIAGILQVANIWIFHLARLINAVFLFYVLKVFLKDYFDRDWSFYTLGILSFGSGLGWLVLAAGWINSDFLIPEMYPFLASFVNPHFPLALGLMVLILKLTFKCTARPAWIQLLLISLLLIIQPFSAVIVICISGFTLVMKWKEINRLRIMSLLPLIIPTSIFGWYLISIISSNPAIQNWNSQNLTPAPPFWDLILALVPMLIPALYGVYIIIKNKESKFYPFIIWLGIALTMVFLPLNLQRRFLIGLYIPICILGVQGLLYLALISPRKVNTLKRVIIATALPSNLLLMGLAIYAVANYDPLLVMKKGVWNSFSWVNENLTDAHIILTTPEYGLFLPAYTYQRVIYGHPFETSNAAENLINLEKYFSGMTAPESIAYVTAEGVDNILIDGDNPIIEMYSLLSKYPLIYENDDVKIFQVKK